MKYQENPDDFQVEGVKLELGELRVKYKLGASGLNEELAEKYEADSSGGILVLLNVQADDQMRDEGVAREIVNRAQKLRKTASLVPTDTIKIYYSATGDLQRVCHEFGDFIQNTLKAEFLDLSKSSKPENVVIQQKMDVKSEELELIIERLSQI